MDLSVIKAAGLRLSDLAEILGTSNANVSRWAAGKAEPTKVALKKNLVRLVAALEKNTNDKKLPIGELTEDGYMLPERREAVRAKLQSWLSK